VNQQILTMNCFAKVKSNVGGEATLRDKAIRGCCFAAAAAVTSYARIHMIPFKLNNNVYYSDTDSIFTDKILDKSLIGSDIASLLMKDELEGCFAKIEEAYFY
jgi:hypothetical protein